MGFLLLVKVPVLWMGISPEYTVNGHPLPPIVTCYHPLFLVVPRRHPLPVITRYHSWSPVTTRRHSFPFVNRCHSYSLVNRWQPITTPCLPLYPWPTVVIYCTPSSPDVTRRPLLSLAVTCCDPSSLVVTLRHPLSPVFNCCTLLSLVTSLSPLITRRNP